MGEDRCATPPGSSGRKTFNKCWQVAVTKEKVMPVKSNNHISAISIIRQFPFDEIKKVAAETKVDYKAKKLKGLNVMVDCVYALLSSSQVSQRIISLENRLPLLSEIPGLEEYGSSTLSHSSLSERLDNINISFFDKSYGLLVGQYRYLVPDDYLDEMSVTRVDSTVVAETANKLAKGISTGITKGASGDRKQLKYTMAYNGLDVTAARVFTKQTYSADNAPISKVVHESLRKHKDMSEFYTFDRALKDVDDINAISDHTKKKDLFFVGRLNKTRRTYCEKSIIGNDKVMRDDDVEVTDDYIGYLRAKDSVKWDTTHQYRFIRVRFVNPRPENPKGARRHKRHYDEEMILITNNTEADAMEIVYYYRKRWDIEVFFKFLKQDLSFSHFISTSVHGIKVMLYMTLIAALLIKLYALNNKMGLRESKIAIINEITTYQYRRIRELQKENMKKDRELMILKIKLRELEKSSDH